MKSQPCLERHCCSSLSSVLGRHAAFSALPRRSLPADGIKSIYASDPIALIGEIIANAKNDGAYCRDTCPVELDAAAFEESPKLESRDAFEQSVLVRIMCVERHSVQGRSLGEILNRDLLEAFDLHQLQKCIQQKSPSPPNPRVQRLFFQLLIVVTPYDLRVTLWLKQQCYHFIQLHVSTDHRAERSLSRCGLPDVLYQFDC